MRTRVITLGRETTEEALLEAQETIRKLELKLRRTEDVVREKEFKIQSLTADLNEALGRPAYYTKSPPRRQAKTFKTAADLLHEFGLPVEDDSDEFSMRR